MPNTTKRGNYYKVRSKDYYESKGFTVQYTEFMCGRVIAPGKVIYQKKDVFGSDLIAMNGTEIIFVNSKHMAQGQKLNSDGQMTRAKQEFQAYPFPPTVKLQIIMWEPRQKPIVYELSEDSWVVVQ